MGIESRASQQKTPLLSPQRRSNASRTHVLPATRTRGALRSAVSPAAAMASPTRCGANSVIAPTNAPTDRASNAMIDRDSPIRARAGHQSGLEIIKVVAHSQRRQLLAQPVLGGPRQE